MIVCLGVLGGESWSFGRCPVVGIVSTSAVCQTGVGMNPGRQATLRVFAVGALLAVVTCFLYWPVRGFAFVNFDDPAYVNANPHVFRGLTAENIQWAFTSFEASNWHPITWLSHMLDCQLFGPRPGWHHCTNVLFHAANAILLFIFLRQTTGALWLSAFVAALFAWHPLRVESVAWIAERKDVLSTFFGLLTLIAYASYVKAMVTNAKSKWLYTLAIVSFALGLMSKPMLVTLPFILLLMDYWPLRRFGTLPVRKLLVEKIPFLVLSVISCGLTIRAQREVILDSGALPFSARLVNAILSYATYLRKMVWPMDLAPFYPYRHDVPTGEMFVAVAVLVGISLICLRYMRRAPFLLIGWLWYLGMLVPVIGVVQVGAQSLADRYTYLPLVGIFVMCIWAVAEVVARVPVPRIVVWFSAMAVGVASIVGTRHQLQYWRDSELLFRRDLDLYPVDNAMAHHCLGRALFLKGDDAGAIQHYREVLRLLPNLPDGHVSMANSLNRLGQFAEAEAEYREAIRLDPKHAEAYKSLGSCLAGQMKLEEARTNLLRALELKPDYAQAHTRLGTLLMAQGKTEEALAHLTAAVKTHPDYDEGQYYLANALMDQKRFPEALEHFRAAIKANPEYAAALNDFAWLLATQSGPTNTNLGAALAAAQRASELTFQTNASHLMTLGIIYSELGKLPDAITVAQRAATLAAANGDADLAGQLQQQLVLYRNHRSATGRSIGP